MRIKIFLAKILVGVGIPLALIGFAYGIELLLEQNKLKAIEQTRPFWGFVAIALLTNVAYGIFKGTLELENSEYVANKLYILAILAFLYMCCLFGFIFIPPYLKEGLSGSDAFWAYVAIGFCAGILAISYFADRQIRELASRDSSPVGG